MKKEQLSMLRHMLGINTPWDKKPKPYRNYAAVTPGDERFVEMERLGFVKNTGRRWQYDCYVCTEAGKAAALKSHKGIRWSRSKRRYNAFLGMCDCFPEMTFRDFLTHPSFADVRREA